MNESNVPRTIATMLHLPSKLCQNRVFFATELRKERAKKTQKKEE